MGCHALVVALIVLSCACTKREVVRPGRGAPAERGDSWQVESRSYGTFHADVVNAYPNGDVVVSSGGQVMTIPRDDIGSMARRRRGRGWVYGAAGTFAGAMVLGLVGGASSGASDGLALGLIIGTIGGLTIGGTIGAIVGAPEVYVYE